jgi:SUMO ligase MMS21 Smc5/6 complex component
MQSGRMGPATADNIGQIYQDAIIELHLEQEKLIDKSDEMIEYKRNVWEAAHPNEPFVIGGDDDLAVIANVGGDENLICPITRMELVEPVRNTCGHVYSKAAIATYLGRHRGRAECPVAGCNGHVSTNSFKPDAKSQQKLSNQKKRKRREDDDNIEDL